jgi:hypothetical protein
MPAESVQSHPPRSEHNGSLWFGVLGAPAAWFIDLEVQYALVPWVCAAQHRIVLHLATAVFLAAAAIAGGISWHHWQALKREFGENPPPGVPARQQFMAGLGLLTSGLFFVVILAQGIPNFFLDPCAK